jgi:hypothetical protein
MYAAVTRQIHASQLTTNPSLGFEQIAWAEGGRSCRGLRHVSDCTRSKEGRPRLRYSIPRQPAANNVSFVVQALYCFSRTDVEQVRAWI